MGTCILLCTASEIEQDSMEKFGMKNWPTAATCHFSTPDGIFWEKQHAPADLPNPPLGWVSVLLLKGQSKCLVHPQWRCRKLI